MTPGLINLKLNRSADVRLFCFPYAGGGDSIFHSWQQSVPAAIEVCPVQLPGRGSRIAEPPFTDISQLVCAAAQALPLDKPFALFGHSMGALIAFELARYLRKEYSAQPLHLFVSGRPSPQTISESYELDQLDAALPEMLPGNPELMELVLPLLRADLAVCKSYVYTPQPPFSFPITAFGGLEDDGVPRHCLEGWREHTTGSFRLRFFPGDHFFLETCRLPLLEAISKELEQDVSRNVM
ncbi:MAG TPA: alpha/beta fold hydrolase [Pyrinomonadaceae bacterium]|nr:alpha/beta fold hydrolase [Pyrinomonadaceae bacterium]